MYIIGIVYSLTYIIYMSLGWNHPPNKKPFRKLLNNKTFLIHFAFQLAIALFGFYRCTLGNYRETFFFAPVFYLLLLRLLDSIISSLEGRHIFFISHGDPKPIGYKWYLDAPLGFLIVTIPFLNSMFLIEIFHVHGTVNSAL